MNYATYSPEDDKLRLYAAARLSAEDYARVKGAGFQWAPKQGCFYAVWSPTREALLEDFTGRDIEDDDKTLTERAEERAERFEGYRDNRAADAESARRAVSAIADGIPLGQPILVGHHSEKHARRDAEKIENGMRRAVKMWKTSQYWTSRAAGALAHAKYKERPDVRHRRIKGLEADRRRLVARYTPDPKTAPQVWDGEEHVWCINGSRGGSWQKTANLPAIEAAAAPWIEHYDNRIAYERAMLAEAGGIGVDRAAVPVQVGGRVRVGKEWCTVIRLNYRAGELVSVTTNRRYVRVVGIEEIAEVEAPAPGAAAAVKAATKLAPLVNFDGEGFRHFTAAEYRRMYADYKSTKTIHATDTHGAYRQRHSFAGGGVCRVVPVFLTDEPVKLPPAKLPIDEPKPEPIAPPAADLAMYEAAMVRDLVPSHMKDAAAATFEAMADSLRAGVKVVSAPHLFPTPVRVAERMAELLVVLPDSRVLEPSAGTGRLVDAVGILTDWKTGPIVAVELNHGLAEGLRAKFHGAAVEVVRADFLEWSTPNKFDRIVMNPPFDNGADIKHVNHALSMLSPGGRLVAIVADGPRQAKAFAEVWDEGEPLESGTFEGTGARARVLVFDVPELDEADGFELRA